MTAEPRRGAFTVLCVDDSLPNLKLLERILVRRPAIAVISATNGRVALQLAREHQPSLVLLDLHLPDIGGEDVLRQLRADPLTARIPVVVVSGEAAIAEIERLRASGAADYLTKPYEISRLLAVVDAHVTARPGEVERSAPERTDSPAGAVLDREIVSALHGLRRDDPVDGPVLQLIGTFLSDGRARLTRLNAFADASNFEQLARVAHSLGGTSANFGARIVAAVCRELETAGRRQDASELTDLTARLGIAFDEAETALRAEFFG